MREARDAVETARAEIDRDIASALDAHGRAALINFPDIPNLGDSAVWLGGYDALVRAGVEVCWVGTHADMDVAEVLATEPEVVVLNGGGNFGDLWEGQQGARERLLEARVGLPIVQLAQSAYFRDPASLERNIALWGANPGAVMLWREERSYSWAARRFPSAHHILSHDMAYGMDPRRIPARQDPAADAIWLVRTDKESAGHEVPELPGSMLRMDWAGPDRGNEELAKLRTEVGRLRQEPEIDFSAMQFAYVQMASVRVVRAFDILSMGDVVVTDRLHGHVLATMLGKEQVIVDNSYGKVFGVSERSANGVASISSALSFDEALALTARGR